MTLKVFIAITAFLVSQPSSYAAKYIQPDEAKELFKVEKIPLHVHQIKEISRYLTIMALGNQGNSPSQQSCSGQLLALALRLDFANQNARIANQKLHDGKSLKVPNAQDIHKAKTQLRILHDWLSAPKSGKNANALAKYLADATRLMYKETTENPDSADWTGVLPSLTSYQKQQ